MKSSLVIVFVVALGACTVKTWTQRTYTREQGVRAVSEIFTKLAGVPPERVDCPEEVVIRSDEAARCTAFAAGIAWPAELERDDDAGEVVVRFNDNIVVDLTLGEKAMSEELAARGHVGVMHCDGPRKRLSVPGVVIPCTFETDTGSKPARLTIEDAEGHIHYDVD